MNSILTVMLYLAVGSIASPITARMDIPESVMVLKQDGTTEVVSHTSWVDSLRASGVLLERPLVNETYLNFTAPEGYEITNRTSVSLDERSLDKRQASCEYTESLVVDTTQSFVDWDVQMSPVVCAVGDMDISVTKGYMVANAVTVTGGISSTEMYNSILGKLGAKVDVSYAKTWTTQSSITTKGTVKDGYCGVMITKPLITRRYGRVFRGCPGSLTQVSTYMADSHGEGSYDGISWISGAISMCTKPGNEPPLSRCSGSGNFI